MNFWVGPEVYQDTGEFNSLVIAENIRYESVVNWYLSKNQRAILGAATSSLVRSAHALVLCQLSTQ